MSFLQRLKSLLRRGPAEDDADPDVMALAVPATSPADDMRRRMFPSIEEYTAFRLSNGRMPDARDLHDAVARSSIAPSSSSADVLSLCQCPTCHQTLRLLPHDAAIDLVRLNGWTLLADFFCDVWRLRRWRAEANQSPPEKITS